MPLQSQIPSRTSMVRDAAGDPFLGALLPALGGLVTRGIPALARGIGRIFRGAPKKVAGISSTSIARGRPASRTSLVQQIGSRILTTGRQAATAIGAGAGVSALLGAAGTVLTDENGMPMRARRRRMNPLNPKALRRATRRLSSFNKMAKKTQAELAKLAPPRARRAPHHGHHGKHHHHDS